MQINSYNYNVNFGAVQLSAKETEKAKYCINKLLDMGLPLKERAELKNTMFKIFSMHLNEEAKKHTGSFRIFNDVLSELYLRFSELLYDIKKNSTVEAFLEHLNKYKPSKDTVKSEYVHSSLDTNVYWDKDLVKKVDRITSNDLPQPKSSAYLEEVKNKIKAALKNSNLPPIIQQRIEARLEGIKFKDIAQNDNITQSTAKRSVKKGIMKVQHSNDMLSEKYLVKIKLIAKTVDLDEKIVVKLCLRNPSMLDMNPETILQNIEKFSELINCDKEKVKKIIPKNPDICLQKPETLMKNIKESAALLGCTDEMFIKSALKLPTLFYLKPQTIHENVQKSAKLFDCDETLFIKLALRQPQLFCQKPQTLKKNIQSTAKNLDCTFSDMIKAALLSPQLFCMKPKTIAKNVRELSDLLYCSEKEFIETALKCPKLFFFKKETLSKKIKEGAKNFGCSEYEYIKMAMAHPHLFSSNTQTLDKRLKVENYYRKIKNEEPKKSPNKDSNEFVYKKIIAYLIQKAKITGTEEFVRTKRNFDLETFIKSNFDKSYSFEIPQDEEAEGFIKYIQETSQKAIGKNIFEFKIQ